MIGTNVLAWDKSHKRTQHEPAGQKQALLLISNNPDLHHVFHLTCDDNFTTIFQTEHHFKTLTTSGIKALTQPTDPIFVEWSAVSIPFILRARDICRQTQKKIIALGHKAHSDANQVAALSAGCDDFFHLPMNPILFNARLKALERRRSHALSEEIETVNNPLPTNSDIATNNTPIHLNSLAHSLNGQNLEILLTRTEYKLMQCFLSNRTRCISRPELLQTVWGVSHETGTNVVDAMIYGLRKKLKQLNVEDLLETVRGRGYRFR